MTDVPQTLTLKRHRDRAGGGHLGLRRVLLGLPLALVIAGLLNLFGQRPTTTTGRSAPAALSVYAPTHVRGGLVYAARFRIDAYQDLKQAILVLDPGWAEQMTTNGEQPQAISQGSMNGRPTYTFGHIPAGRHLTFWLSLQVNPTNVGRRAQDVWLYDGKQLLVHVHRELTVFP